MANTSQLVQPPQKRLQITDETGMLTGPGVLFLQGITSALNGTQGVAAPGVNKIALGTGQSLFFGSGNPNGVVAGNIGDQYTNSAGGAGTTLFVKESGAGTGTGWVGK